MNLPPKIERIIARIFVQIMFVFLFWNNALITKSSDQLETTNISDSNIQNEIVHYPITPTPVIIASSGNPTPTPTPNCPQGCVNIKNQILQKGTQISVVDQSLSSTIASQVAACDELNCEDEESELLSAQLNFIAAWECVVGAVQQGSAIFILSCLAWLGSANIDLMSAAENYQECAIECIILTEAVGNLQLQHADLIDQLWNLQAAYSGSSCAEYCGANY